MNILIVSQYFWPENFRINDLARDLKQKGHSVTVLTGVPNYPDGQFFEGYGIFKKTKEDFDGILVRRVPLVPRGKSKGARLALNYMSFAFFASVLGPIYCSGRYDAILVFEPSPITVGIPAIVLKKLKRAPIWFWVLDLWPESLSATGAISSGLILEAVARLVRFIYRHCDRILVSSKGFVDSVSAAGAPRERILYFPNWAEDVYWETATKRRANDMQALPAGFKIMFAGNIGVAQSFPTILAAAESLREIPDIHWIIIGDGRMSDWVADEIRARSLGHCVHLLGRHPPETTADFFSEADALLITLKRDPAFSLTVPGKLQSYLACGKPIIASIDGEGARIIDEAGAGISCPAENASALAGAVLSLRSMSAESRAKMGRNGLQYCKLNFDRSTLLGKLEGWLRESSERNNDHLGESLHAKPQE